MPSPRLACLLVPLFPLAARLRSEPELRAEAVVVVTGSGSNARVVAATRLARRAGVQPGMTLAQARALLPKLVARSRDPECEGAAQEALLEVAERFSPRIEDGTEGLAYLDLTGLERCFSGKQVSGKRLAGEPPDEPPEPALGRALIAAADAAGLALRVGIAGSKLAARVAATQPSSPVVVPAGREAEFLAPLPLERLGPSLAVAATLQRWGVRTAGEFARLPEAEVASRLGAAGQGLHATARGVDPQPLMPRQPPPSFREGSHLEWPLVTLEPFLFVGRAALERLCQRLASHGLACRRLELSLQLEPDGYHQRSIDLPAPTREVKTLLTLVRLELEARSPGAPVTGFTFTAHPDRPRQAQLSLFGPEALSPDALATTLARLFALLGPDRVGSPRPLDRHRPEGFALVDYTPPPPPTLRPPPRRGRGLLAMRALRPPVELEVLTAGPEPAGDPATLRLLSLKSTPAADGERRPHLDGRVRVASGPWGVDEDWWCAPPAERDYWDVELATGGLYRIYRDRCTGSWYADGVYD